MNNEELKKKITEIIGDVYLVNAPIKDVYKPIFMEKIADALIAAGIGDVKDLQAQVDALEITNIALQAGHDGAEKDRLYWVNKYKEAEHRAEIAERAGKIAVNKVFDYTWDEAVAQAEEELAEERKDEN